RSVNTTAGRDADLSLGFSSGALEVELGLMVYIVTNGKYLADIGKEVKNPLKSGDLHILAKRVILGLLFFVLVVFVVFYTGHLSVQLFINFISVLGLLIPVSYFIVMIFSKKTTKTERSRVIAYIPMFIGAMMFWTIQEQGAIIMAQYADQRTQLEFLGITLDPGWFQSVNPIFIVVFAPVFAALWTKLGDKQPSTPHKFTIGIFLAGCSFLLLTIPGLLGGTDSLVNPLWL